MTLGLKIQDLRKKAQLTQDELAEILGVSRQALSKWENDTSIPDIDKVILISESFSVTTDYLLKDSPIQQSCHEDEKKIQSMFQMNPKSLIISISIIVFIGLIISISMQYSSNRFNWTFKDAALGSIIQLIGIGLFTVFHINLKYDKTSLLWFWLINIWFITLMPYVLLSSYTSNVLLHLFPNVINHYTIAYSVGDLIYLVINGTISLILFRLIQRNKRTSKT
jgi:transcriptional regulator with XRE-family HTH domain